jgi:ring-1,2-phenylacetyl-CoA epoxidase subunit PaaE
MSNQFHSLRIKDKIQETAETVSIKFEVPPDLKDAFKFKAGQYLTLKFNIKGADARRAYSMSSSPLENDITVTVKRVDKGLVSNYIHDNLNIGDSVETMVPQGRFVAKLNDENRKTYYLLGAGSGITPLMSILKTVLEEEAQSSVFLFYGSRNEEQIIFKKELDALENKYAGQLHVSHILSQPKQIKSGGIVGMFGKKKNLWLGDKGRIDRRTSANFFEKSIPPYPTTEYFMCGPGNMIQTVEDVLIARGVSKKLIHFEMFNSELPGDGSQKKSTEQLSSSDSTKAVIHLDGNTFNASIAQGQTILDALLALKKEPPYSCTTGSCSTCMAKIIKGSATMDVCYALDDDEIEEGYILTCQAKATSPEIEVDYDA